MAGKMKTRLALAGLLAGSVALGTTGCKRAEAQARPQDVQQQQQQDPGTLQQDQDTSDQSGTGGAGDTGTLQQDQDTSDQSGTGGSGTGSTPTTPPGSVREEDEGVLQPGVNDEGLDNQQGQVDQDTYYQGVNPQQSQQQSPQR